MLWRWPCRSAAALLAADIDPEMKLAAQRVAATTCATCHGPQGRSSTPKFPVLAGQHASYLIAQMKAFKAQTRGDPDALGYMWGMAAPLDDAMIEALAAYYSAQAPGKGHAGDAATVARGAEIFSNGIAAEGIPPCVSCHGANAAGTDDFPRLAGQHSAVPAEAVALVPEQPAQRGGHARRGIRAQAGGDGRGRRVSAVAVG